MVRMVKVLNGTGFPVGYGSLVSSGPDGVKWDSTGAAYLTVSCRPAKNRIGKSVVVVATDVDVSFGEGRRVKWAILVDDFFCHS